MLKNMSTRQLLFVGFVALVAKDLFADATTCLCNDFSPDTAPCVRFHSNDGGQDRCQVETCRRSFECDTNGTEVCTLVNSTKWEPDTIVDLSNPFDCSPVDSVRPVHEGASLSYIIGNASQSCDAACGLIGATCDYNIVDLSDPGLCESMLNASNLDPASRDLSAANWKEEACNLAFNPDFYCVSESAASLSSCTNVSPSTPCSSVSVLYAPICPCLTSA